MRELSFGTRAAGAWLLAMAVFCCAGCTDQQLHKYRNDEFVQSYHYALGEQQLKVNGNTLCYQEYGQGPTLLILPGLGTSIDYWQLVIPELAKHFHVLAVDPPGFGKSEKPEVSYELKWIVDQIIAFMDAKHVTRTDVMGASLGGHLALMLAHEQPQRVSRLVLMGSCGSWPEPSLMVDLTFHLLWHDFLIVDHVRRRWSLIYNGLFTTSSKLRDALLAYQLALMANREMYEPEGRAFSRALRSIFYSSCRPFISEIKQPTLLIWGQYDRIHLISEGIYLHEHLPNAQLVVVPDASHQVIIDEPERFLRLALRFLNTAEVASSQPSRDGAEKKQ